MSRQFITARLKADSDDMAKVRALFTVVPTFEPANGGPDDNEFIQAMEEAADISADDTFPDPYFTAHQQYNVKK